MFGSMDYIDEQERAAQREADSARWLDAMDRIDAQKQAELLASERQQILRAIEHAPAAPIHQIVDLLGWRTNGGLFICARDASRIFARGCQIPTGSAPAWKSEPVGDCVCCAAERALEADREHAAFMATEDYFLRVEPEDR